jgi:pimeloyl-ACP methyl ester carboxylesterase
MTRVKRASGRAGCLCVLVALCALVLASLPPLYRAARALTVLTKLTGLHALDPLATRLLEPIGEQLANLDAGGAMFRTRRYAPTAAVRGRPGVLLLHGVHPRGIDESRLVDFARVLAAGGLDVLTPELPELLAYRLDGATIAHIRQLAAAHAAQTHTAAVGVIGISFAGGLALMAAAEQGAAAPIGFVATIGAHHDLLRLTDYYAGRDVRGPNGERVDVAPHPYGARVMIREHLDRFFSAQDLPLARRALDVYLHDHPAQARAVAAGLSPAAQPRMAALLGSGSSPELAELLESSADAARLQLMAASPHHHLEGIQVPVFLLHGAGDPIIPSIETRYLARELPPRWLREAIVTPLLRHAEFPQPPKVAEAWELVRFIKEVYEAAGSAARDPESPQEGTKAGSF